MAKGTKEKILDAALVQFSEYGYSGTNIQSIADSVGIVKSALYRHFRSKEEIWIAIQDRMTEYYEQRFGSVDNLPPVPSSAEELFELTMRMVNFTIHEKNIIMVRRLLLTEQFRDERVRGLASRFFLYDTRDIFEAIFAEMMKNGVLRKDDPRLLAFSFTAPITSLIHLCDREPEKEVEVMEQIQAFARHFIEEYKCKGE